MFKKILWLVAKSLLVLIVIVAICAVLIRALTHPLKGAAIVSLAHSNLGMSLFAILVIFILLNSIGTFLAVIIIEIDVNDADKFLTGTVKFSFIAATVLGLLLTESSDEFQLVATIVSFVLIFQYFFPKELKDAFVDVQRKLVNKWNGVHKDKDKN